ncbi:MAG: TatD family hydrolase [Gammaproteobacteria bacterium]|jgi:TatD DNase family protein
MELIDVGVNLTHDSFDADRDEVIAAAKRAGVRRMIVTGTTVQASRDAAALARRHPGDMFATAGIHPHHATECTAHALSELGILAASDRIVAIGECGLDYFRNFSPPDVQRDAFEAQLQLAVDLELPVFLHQREAHDDFLAIVRNFRSGIVDALAHCFTGSATERDHYLDLDMHIGVTGWVCDERRGHDLQAAIPGMPLQRLLVETDAPYLLPRTVEPKPKSRRNEPSMLPWVVREVARLKETDEEEIAAASTANAERFFRLPGPDR